jgi:DNA-binding CsgD family transcriptional regulator/tetratricopeptide (TPR) repeat protein
MGARARAPFVGRARQLAELEHALATAEAGSGATVLVAGEAGIGKTRLASELAARAGDAGFEVLLGRSIDLIGTELPYQPFVDALRPLGEHRPHVAKAVTQLRVFEQTLELLASRAAAAPVLLVLEDVHWADTSTLDLVVFLAHNLGERRILLLATYRAGEPSSAERMRRLADGVRRSGSPLLIELDPLTPDELTTLLAAHSEASPSRALADEIVARSEGNPFFAEELLAAGEDDRGLPRELQDLLLQRIAQLDARTQSLLRLAAAAGRDVGYDLLRVLADRPEPDLQDSLREAVEGGVLVPEQGTDRFRFRHPLLAEAIYATILPGEREEVHAKLAKELTRSGAASQAELAPHWAAAGRSREALVASVDAAAQAEAVFGLAEAHAHLERALALWPAVPDAAGLAGLDLAALCTWTARLASQVAESRGALELTRRAIDLVGSGDPRRASLLHVSLGEYLYEIGSNDAAFAALERAVELAQADPESRNRAYSLASLAGGLMMAWRHSESLAAAEEALELARRVGAVEAEVRALTVVGMDLAYLGRGEEGVAYLRQALQLAEEAGDHWGLDRVYVNFTDALAMLGRPRESVRLGRAGLAAMRRCGIDSPLLVSNLVEALLMSGEWDEADRLSAAALRGVTSTFPDALFIARALVETERGEFDAARAHFQAAELTLPADRRGVYEGWLADLALWEHRWADADTAIENGLARASQREAAQVRVQVCARGLRAQAELAALARARRDADALRDRLRRACRLLGIARRAAAEAAVITPNAGGWLALAEAEHRRARAEARPEAWIEAAATWDLLERPPLAAYCRWRQAEALVAAGASRNEASVPLREAHAVATQIGARPLLRELELLAERARLDLVSPTDAGADAEPGFVDAFGLTPREAEVLTLVARGYTNREIAAALVISVKTAGVHVSHILGKLDAPNRREAAAIAHRLAPPDIAARLEAQPDGH